MSKVEEYSVMTKDRLMIYTFVALLVLVGVSAVSFGITSLIVAAITVLVAVGIDLLLAKVAADSQMNIMSAAVFGLIVALSYSLGLPTMRTIEALPLTAPDAYVWVAFISAVGMTLFKKLQGLLGRKYVNPAATAKLLVFLPFLDTVLMAKDHLASGDLGMPALAGPLGYDVINNIAASTRAEMAWMGRRYFSYCSDCSWHCPFRDLPKIHQMENNRGLSCNSCVICACPKLRLWRW
jgi:hypothetical protein